METHSFERPKSPEKEGRPIFDGEGHLTRSFIHDEWNGGKKPLKFKPNSPRHKEAAPHLKGCLQCAQEVLEDRNPDAAYDKKALQIPRNDR